jgi:hypothetical protein
LHHLDKQTKQNDMFSYKYLPLINCFIAGTALTFQVTILNPRLKDISKQMDEIEKRLIKK